MYFSRNENVENLSIERSGKIPSCIRTDGRTDVPWFHFPSHPNPRIRHDQTLTCLKSWVGELVPQAGPRDNPCPGPVVSQYPSWQVLSLQSLEEVLSVALQVSRCYSEAQIIYYSYFKILQLLQVTTSYYNTSCSSTTVKHKKQLQILSLQDPHQDYLEHYLETQHFVLLARWCLLSYSYPRLSTDALPTLPYSRSQSGGVCCPTPTLDCLRTRSLHYPTVALNQVVFAVLLLPSTVYGRAPYTTLQSLSIRWCLLSYSYPRLSTDTLPTLPYSRSQSGGVCCPTPTLDCLRTRSLHYPTVALNQVVFAVLLLPSTVLRTRSLHYPTVALNQVVFAVLLLPSTVYGRAPYTTLQSLSIRWCLLSYSYPRLSTDALPTLPYSRSQSGGVCCPTPTLDCLRTRSLHYPTVALNQVVFAVLLLPSTVYGRAPYTTLQSLSIRHV